MRAVDELRIVTAITRSRRTSTILRGMHPVDALLEQAQHLLGTPSAVTVTASEAFAGQLADMHPPSWEGDASSRAAAATGLLDTDRNKVHGAHQSVGTVVTTANEIGQRARTRLDAVTAAWRQDKALTRTDSPEGQAALLRAGQQRIADANQIVEGAAADYRHAAGQVRNVTADLPTDGVTGHPKDSPAHRWTHTRGSVYRSLTLADTGVSRVSGIGCAEVLPAGAGC